MNWLKRLVAAFAHRWSHRNGCDGKPFHNGMCRCECDTHYLGL